MNPYRPIFLVGPTGSGKSALALRLAERVGGEIVNADAFQVYRELSIITARPSEAEMEQQPHHLYGCLSVSETCDAGAYAEIAKPVLEEISNRERIPIVTGGSGLYLKALTHGLADAPRASVEQRAELNELSLEALQKLLLEKDPGAEGLIHLQNRRYVQRALEITLATGTPWSEGRKAWSIDPPELRGILITRHREDLYRRIESRVETMFAEGAVEEVQGIREWSVTSERAIGVQEIQRLLAGEWNEETCIEQIQQSSRRYAKRQITWFRRENWLDSLNLSEAWEQEFGEMATKLSDLG